MPPPPQPRLAFLFGGLASDFSHRLALGPLAALRKGFASIRIKK